MLDTALVNTVSFQTDDFEELSEAAPSWDQNYHQMSPGNFKGRIDLTQVGSRQIMREFWSRKIWYRGKTPPGSFGFALPIKQQGRAIWMGRLTSGNSVIVQVPGQESDFISSNFWDSLIFSVSEAEVHKTISALSQRDSFGSQIRDLVVLQPHKAERLKRLGQEFLFQTRVTTPERIAWIEQASEQLIKLLIWELVDAQIDRDARVQAGNSAKIVDQVFQLALEDENAGIGLTDVCMKLHVSLRRLHYAFQEVIGISPATWLRRIRLNRVHKILLQSSPDDILIKSVAIENGFFHLGHFANQYQNHFGCLPSQTLQKLSSACR